MGHFVPLLSFSSRASAAVALLAAAVTFAACAADPAPPSAPVETPPDPSSDLDATDTLARPADGGTEASADARSDALPPDGGPDLLSHPPIGATKCGGGAITPAAAHAACLTASTQGPDPGYARACNLDSAGGVFEVWCAASGTYFFARLDGLRPQEPRLACQGIIGGKPVTYYPDSKVGPATLEVRAGLAGAFGSLPVRGLLQYLDKDPVSLVLEGQVSTISAAAGTANAWVIVRPSPCSGDVDPPPVYGSGVAFVWP